MRILATIALCLTLAFPAFAGPSPTQGDIWVLDRAPTGSDVQVVAGQADQFKAWGGTKKGLSMLPGGKDGVIDLETRNFGRDGKGIDSQDWKNVGTTVRSEKGFPIRTIYARVQDGVDYGSMTIRAKGQTAIGTQTIAPLKIERVGPQANGSNIYVAISFHRPVTEAELTFTTGNYAGGKKANGFQVEVLAVSKQVCPDDLHDGARASAKAVKAKADKSERAKAAKAKGEREAKQRDRRDERKGKR